MNNEPYVSYNTIKIRIAFTDFLRMQIKCQPEYLFRSIVSYADRFVALISPVLCSVLWRAGLSNILEYSRSTSTKSWLKISLMAIQRWISFRPAILMGSTPLRNSINRLASSSYLDSSHCGLTVIFVYRYPMKMLSDIFHREHFLQQHKKKIDYALLRTFFQSKSISESRAHKTNPPTNTFDVTWCNIVILQKDTFRLQKTNKIQKIYISFFLQPLYLAHSVNIHHSVRSNLPMK